MRSPIRLLALLAVLAACVPAFAGCARGGSGAAARRGAPGDTAVVAADAARLRALATAPGAPATLLHVWATWCDPCREEFPMLVRVLRRHPDVRVLFVSADFDDQLPAVKSFLGAHGWTDSSYLKAGGDQDFIDGIDSTWSGALPATVVYDAHGRRVAFWEGAADSARFEAALANALAPHSP